MTTIIQMPKQGGKTTYLLNQMQLDPRLHYVAATEARAGAVYQRSKAEGRGLDRGRFLSANQSVQSAWAGRYAVLAVDDLDLVLSRLLGLPVSLATFSGGVVTENRSTRGADAQKDPTDAPKDPAEAAPATASAEQIFDVLDKGLAFFRTVLAAEKKGS